MHWYQLLLWQGQTPKRIIFQVYKIILTFMKKIFLILTFVVCATYNTHAQTVFCTLTGNNLSVNLDYVKQNLTSSDSEFLSVSSTEQILQTGFGNVTLKFANETPEEEYGFNIISIRIGTRKLLNIKQDNLWTYTFGGKSMIDLKTYTNNRYFIPITINTSLSLIVLCGWPYGGDMPLLTIIAITPNEAKVIYNRHADITNLQKSPFCMTVQTNLVEYYDDGTPMTAAQSSRIFYNNGQFIYN